MNEDDLSVAHVNSLPEIEALADSLRAAGLPISEAPMLVIVLQDNLQTGEIEIAGVQRPAAFDNTSATHVVGRWLSTRMEQIVEAARSATSPAPQTVQPLRAASGALMMPSGAANDASDTPPLERA